jgi:potassium efflux system protein
LAMITLTVFIAKVFSPRGAVLSAMAERGDSSLLLKTRYLWSPAVIVTPLALAALSASGFQYSAMQLQNRLQATAWLIILLIVLSELAMRWVRVTQRRNAFATAVAERAERMRARAERLKNPEEELLHGNAGDEPDVTEPEVSETEVREQIGSVLRTVVGAGAILGVWLIWAAVLPALNVLNEIGLWTQIVQVDGIDQLKAVTIIDVIAALLVAVMAWVSTRNLPGALELAVLNRTTMDSGAKYAFTTLSRYIIAGVGIVTVFSLLGMRWSQLQWLVAALSVGLGFGLQEIVANFVSGVILLFERPIRVGDIVTVGGKEGTVSRIQIRATTLTDWDQKEVVIPNKTFITGEVTNWTLTNAVNRILIPVGVAYGTDTEKAMRLLPKIASDHPRVLADPAPFAAFDGFGDSALNLSLRCYIPNLDGRVHVISELCASIDAAFKDAAISIPFPQRDLHINSVRPLDVRVLRDGEV